jgi:glutamate formiminotransferase/formiminotetrahydrofolate cyclodeaminase
LASSTESLGIIAGCAPLDLQTKETEVFMTTPIIECVPNFSDARRPEVIEAIQAAIIEVKDVYILDRHMDSDHNRTVITFVGSPAGVEEAAYRAIAKAAELIDLNKHTGEHPRIGATDVVPFIPISGATMDDCIEIAKRLGQRVAAELDIPVYLYEEAAASDDRRNLATHRKGQFETLKDAIQTDPKRTPDFGPKKLGPAGATVIGAREFLVAYNVYLTTGEVAIAKKISRTIRHSSGGLRYVKALGMQVDSPAQVSMNLTNFRKTPIALVVETIRREALRYGVGIHHSELVGLIPQDALVEAAVWYTQMDQFEPDQVLETRLYATLKGQTTDRESPAETVPPQPPAQNLDLIDALADGAPTPGGGSAAAYSGAMGAALVAMVARLTLGKKKYAEISEQMLAILDEAEFLKKKLMAAVQEDSTAFNKVMSAFRLPKGSEEEKATRAAAIAKATLHAAEVPLETARFALRVMELALRAAEIGNPNAITDAGTGAALAQAALTGAGYNIRINALDLNTDEAELFIHQLEQLESKAIETNEQLHETLRERGGIAV